MHVASARADAVAADVGVMNGRTDIGEDAVTVEDRRQHRDVEKCPADIQGSLVVTMSPGLRLLARCERGAPRQSPEN